MSNENPAKTPRGSKLDAKKRQEYEADVAQVEGWDTSLWPTWTVTGRVLPERCQVTVAARTSQGASAGGRFRLRFEVTQSHIAAVCAVEKENASVFEIADIVRSALAFPVDYIAFQNRGAYETVLDLCINNKSGQSLTIPIFEPTFASKDAGLCFDAHDDKSNIVIPYAAGGTPELATALHDLTSAVRYPRRTFEHCRMAVEVVRRHFDPPDIRDHGKRVAGEVALCTALQVERKSLLALDAVAARGRHGNLVVSISWEMRKRVLEFAWEVIARFIKHLDGTAHDPWKLLDIQFED
jgi:hypothetical protein